MVPALKLEASTTGTFSGPPAAWPGRPAQMTAVSGCRPAGAAGRSSGVMSSSRLSGAVGWLAGEGRGKLGAGVDAQLAEGVGEVGLDGLLGDEQALGDLAVRLPGAGHAGNAQFAGGEGVAAAGGGSPRPGTGGEQFGQRAVLQSAVVALMGQRQAFFQRVPG